LVNSDEQAGTLPDRPQEPGAIPLGFELIEVGAAPCILAIDIRDALNEAGKPNQSFMDLLRKLYGELFLQEVSISHVAVVFLIPEQNRSDDLSFWLPGTQLKVEFTQLLEVLNDLHFIAYFEGDYFCFLPREEHELILNRDTLIKDREVKPNFAEQVFFFTSHNDIRVYLPKANVRLVPISPFPRCQLEDLPLIDKVIGLVKKK